jgi:hypothetical protein
MLGLVVTILFPREIICNLKKNQYTYFLYRDAYIIYNYSCGSLGVGTKLRAVRPKSRCSIPGSGADVSLPSPVLTACVSFATQAMQDRIST